MTKAKTLRIGIATLDQMRDRTIAIARGTHRRAPDEPKVWFRSIESLAKILSEGNREVLAVIAAEHPQSIEELAKLTGRKKSNLSRTLRTMEEYGIVQLDRGARGRIAPSVKHRDFTVHFSLV
jgi:predicted transcriptional regulator